jgi:hypothetical protein
MKKVLRNYLLLIVPLLTGCATHGREVHPINNAAKPMCNKAISAQFLRWNKANGKELKGLTKRRLDEMKLFMKGCE